MVRYRGVCAQCGMGENHFNFRTRPAGRKFEAATWKLEDSSGRKLRFFTLDKRNDRVCSSCFVANFRLLAAPAQPAVTSPAQAPPRKRRFDQENMRNVCSKYLDVPALEKVLRVLELLGEERVWRFAENMPQQNNGRDCGIFAMEVARSRVRAALAADKDKDRAEKDYQNLSHRRAASYRRRLGAEFRDKKCDVAAKP